MSPLLPDAASLKTAVAAINALDARLTALEKDHAALKAQLVKGDELRARLGALEEFAAMNRLALRAIFTVFHPMAEHDRPEEQTRELALGQAQGIHRLLMEWIERLGGRLPLP